HARAEEDSTRFAAEAAKYRAMPAAAGSVEFNAIQRWREDFSTAAANPSHPCNLAVEEDR
ncbi:MAG TPA: hypothetical protein VFQ39_13180, partial [Longimicrobium sp.]|nr:hypothetical protein [Longimicrobium sp.]